MATTTPSSHALIRPHLSNRTCSCVPQLTKTRCTTDSTLSPEPGPHAIERYNDGQFELTLSLRSSKLLVESVCACAQLIFSARLQTPLALLPRIVASMTPRLPEAAASHVGSSSANHEAGSDRAARQLSERVDEALVAPTTSHLSPLTSHLTSLTSPFLTFS